MEENNLIEIINYKFNKNNSVKKFNLNVKKETIHAVLFKDEDLKENLINHIKEKYSQNEDIYFIDRYSAVNPEKDPLAIFKFKSQEEKKNKSTVMPNMTVAENIFFGREPEKSFLFFKAVDSSKMNEKTSSLLAELELDLKATQKMGNLNSLEKQLVALAKFLSYETDILIIDEAAAELKSSQKEIFFKYFKKLKERGITIIYFTREIEEVFTVSDYVSVLKNNQENKNLKVSDLEYNELALLLMGKENK